MSPLAWVVIAFGVGCVAGGVVALDPEIAVRLALAAVAMLVLGMRLGWAGHGIVGVGASTMGAVCLGVGLGALAEARAWAPPGLDVNELAQATANGELVTVSGVLRRDAWVSDAGDVALDVRVDRLWWRHRWRATTVGVRVTVSGEGALPLRHTWTRGRRIEAVVSSIRRPLPYRNLGVPDAERALARRGLRLFATVKSAALVETTRGPWWEELAARARSHVRTVVATYVADPVSNATVTAILIGDRSRLPDALVRDLQHAGVYHVVAISGGNVGIWLALLVWLPRSAGAGVRSGTVWLAAGLLGFAVVVDGGASVARAVTVAAVVIAARWWDVRATATQALLVAALVQLMADPLVLHDPGCVLSFGAAGTLVYVASFGSRVIESDRGGVVARVWPRRIAIALVASLGATLAIELVLLPITARWFNVATAAGLFANLLAVPAMGVVQVAGLGVLAAASVWPTIGPLPGVVATLGVRALLRSADVLAVAPWLVREVPPPGLGSLAVYYVALAAAVGGFVRVRHPRVRGQPRGAGRRVALQGVSAAAAVLAVGGLAWIVTGGLTSSAPSSWTWPAARQWQRASWPGESWLLVTVLDVGQGDATVVRFPSGRTWLIDAGGSTNETFDVGERVTSPALWALGHRRLDRVVITHAHPDHAAGMPSVIRRFEPREVLSGVTVVGDARHQAVTEAAMRSSARERWLAAGEAFAEGAVHVSVRHPERPDWARRRVRNDDSVVLWLRYGDVGVLLPGDIGEAVEGRLAGRFAAAPLTVLRLAHHGSASSSGGRLLDTLQPVLAIGSMARGNRFGHPARPVVQRLAERRIPLLRTDEVGAIQLATNGRVLLMRTASGLHGSFSAGPPPRAWWLATPPPSAPAWPP